MGIPTQRFDSLNDDTQKLQQSLPKLCRVAGKEPDQAETLRDLIFSNLMAYRYERRKFNRVGNRRELAGIIKTTEKLKEKLEKSTGAASAFAGGWEYYADVMRAVAHSINDDVGENVRRSALQPFEPPSPQALDTELHELLRNHTFEPAIAVLNWLLYVCSQSDQIIERRQAKDQDRHSNNSRAEAMVHCACKSYEQFTGRKVCITHSKSENTLYGEGSIFIEEFLAAINIDISCDTIKKYADTFT